MSMAKFCAKQTGALLSMLPLWELMYDIRQSVKHQMISSLGEGLRGLQVIVREELSRVAGKGHAPRGQIRQAEAKVIVLEDLCNLAPRVPSGVSY